MLEISCENEMLAFMILPGFIFMLKEELNRSSPRIAHKMGMIIKRGMARSRNYDTKERNATALPERDR
jgi:hypothetical protein